jgi:hypothetical protein
MALTSPIFSMTFAIQGPNRIHECLITEILTSMNDFMYRSAFQAQAKKITFQMILGLFYFILHEQGITHGTNTSSVLLRDSY